MPTFTAEQLRAAASGTWLHGRLPADTVSGFTQDSRLLRSGMCFVALKTAQRDGHAFLAAALEAGAAMALVSSADESCPLPQLVVADVLLAFQHIARAHRLSFAGKVVGVTGSCGKTSTKNILHTLLGEGCHATAGNLNNFIGVPLTLLGLETGKGQGEAAGGCKTPAESSAPVQTAPQFAVIEAGISEPGEMAVLADMIRPDIALITMVGAAHLLDLGSVAGVAAEKSVLAHAMGDLSGGLQFSGREAGADSAADTARLPLLFTPLECFGYPAFAALKNEGVAVMQNESVAVTQSENAALLAELPAGIALHRYALECANEQQGGAEAFLSIEGERLCGRFALGFVPSAGMASNLALALIAAHTLGVSADLLAQRVQGWQPQGNRGSWKTFGAQRFFVDCYNANPSSMQDSLSHFVATLAAERGDTPSKPRLYVIGGMRELGAQSAALHNQLGLSLGIAAAEAERGDVVVSIGEAKDNAALEAGVRVNAPTLPVYCFAHTQDARALVSAFEGIIFLKGSRFYALEALLPQETLA